MSEYVEKLKIWWSPLSVREKQSVLFGSISLVIFLFYVVVWSPLSAHIDDMRKQITTGEKTLQFMQSAEKQIQQHQGDEAAAATVASPVELLSYLQKQLDKSGLAGSVTQMKQSSDDAVTLKFQTVAFDRLIRLLLLVMKEQRVSVDQLTAIAGNTPGVASVDLVLKLG